MLPKRIPREPKPDKRWRSPAHLNFVRSHECCVPGCHERPIEAAHVRLGGGGGMGFKPGDDKAISLCRSHHASQHAMGERSFQAAHAIDMLALAEEFARASPKWPEIRAERSKRDA